MLINNAVELLKEEVAALRAELDQAKLIISGKTFNYPSDYGLLKADRDELQRLNQELDKSLSESDAENDKLMAEVAALKGDNDKFLASDDCYYWTPERQKEFDEMKAEIERLKVEEFRTNLSHGNNLRWRQVAEKERDELKTKEIAHIQLIDALRVEIGRLKNG